MWGLIRERPNWGRIGFRRLRGRERADGFSGESEPKQTSFDRAQTMLPAITDHRLRAPLRTFAKVRLSGQFGGVGRGNKAKSFDQCQSRLLQFLKHIDTNPCVTDKA
jgi:hypothetical protein